jgi:hypothetical protein
MRKPISMLYKYEEVTSSRPNLKALAVREVLPHHARCFIPARVDSVEALLRLLLC